MTTTTLSQGHPETSTSYDLDVERERLGDRLEAEVLTRAG